VSTVLRQTSNLTPCAIRLSTACGWDFRAQQVDAGAEGHHLDRDLVGVVSLQQIVGDADDRPSFFGSLSESCSTRLVLGERLVRQRRLLR
jgi:hypothetical protein